MEKESKMKNKNVDDEVNIAKIYETIKDKGFIQDLWLDVMSDMKEKPSYVRLKSMVDKVISSAVDDYASKPKNHEERLNTRTIFSQLSIMTYTIDTLISEVLHKKLKDEFKSIISNIVDDLKSRQMMFENENVCMLEGIGNMLCNGSHIKQQTQSYASDDEDALSIESDSSTNSAVSSIHTSDLSSFEDNISISSEDDNGVKIKKKVPLKIANKLYANDELNKLHEVGKKKKKIVASSKPSLLSNTFENSPNRRLPARTRKPNSKYSSDDVICPIKQSLLQSDSSTSDNMEFDEVSLSTNGTQNEKSIRKRSQLKNEKQYKLPYNIDRVTKIIGSPCNLNIMNKSNVHTKMFNDTLSKKQSATKTSRISNSPNKSLKVNVNISLSKSSEDLEAVEKRKRGRPSNKAKAQTSLIENKQHVSSVIFKKKNETLAKEPVLQEIKRKRGRPSLQDVKHRANDVQKSSALNNEKTIVKRNLKITKKRNNSEILIEPINKKIKQTDDISKTNDKQVKHSIESFSILEEKLCLKDRKIVQPISLSKTSTKSYEKTDLYKPHSDFRVFNSRGSKAFTLFSN